MSCIIPSFVPPRSLPSIHPNLHTYIHTAIPGHLPSSSSSIPFPAIPLISSCLVLLLLLHKIIFYVECPPRFAYEVFFHYRTPSTSTSPPNLHDLLLFYLTTCHDLLRLLIAFLIILSPFKDHWLACLLDFVSSSVGRPTYIAFYILHDCNETHDFCFYLSEHFLTLKSMVLWLKKDNSLPS